MAIILASSFNCTKKCRNSDKRRAIPITDVNAYLTNIKKFVQKYDNFVLIANDPSDCEMNDYRFGLVCQSLEMSGLIFKNKTFLDNRNKRKAKEIISNADLIFLQGGCLPCQLEFFARIGLKKLIQQHNGLIVGSSAGAMNLCQTVFNYPEVAEEIDDRQGNEFFLRGLGFYNQIFVPHFDGKKKRYCACTTDFDPLRDYILPLSHGREFIACNDGAYILLDGGAAQYFGDFYLIKDGSIVGYKN